MKERKRGRFLKAILLLMVYQIIIFLLLPIILAYLFYRHFFLKKEPFHLERFGYFKNSFSHFPSSKSPIWIHAASVGEALSIHPLVKQLGPVPILLTVGTETGKKVATEHYSPQVTVLYPPYDFLPFLFLFLKKWAPCRFICVESEMWPGMITTAFLSGCSIYSFNKQMKEKTAKRYYTFSFLFKPLLSLFSHLYVQEEEDKKKLSAFVPASKITPTGNIKVLTVFEKLPSPFIKKKYSLPVVILGSFHEGEKELCTLLYHSHLLFHLILVPRHSYWIGAYIKELRAKKISYSVVEKNSCQHVEELLNNCDEKKVVIVLEMGVLFSLYQQATLAVIGGSFVPVGGHNCFEPLVWEVPTFIGPYNSNFKNKKLLSCLIFTSTVENCCEQISTFISNEEKCFQIESNTKAIIMKEKKRIAIRIKKIRENFA